jgi:glutathione S-transferase
MMKTTARLHPPTRRRATALSSLALACALGLGMAASPSMAASQPQPAASEAKPILTIYHLEGRRSERVVWLCEELGLPYTLEYKRGDLRGSMAQIRALNPLMPVAPTVLYGDQVIVESGAILEMLLARHGDGRLRPAVDSPDFPYYLQWMHYSEGSFAARVIGDYRVEMIRRSTSPSPLVDAEDTIRFAEDYLSRHPYFGGAEFSAADIMMLFPLNVATSTRIADISQFPNLAAWREKIEQRPAYQRMLAVARPDGVIGSLPPLPGR